MQKNLPLYEPTLYNKTYIHQRLLTLKTENSTFGAGCLNFSTHICLDLVLKEIYTDFSRAESCEKENMAINLKPMKNGHSTFTNFAFVFSLLLKHKQNLTSDIVSLCLLEVMLYCN